jgi:hypothetical protein
LGDTLDAAPHGGLAEGRISDTKPALILLGGGQGNISRLVLPELSRTHPLGRLSPSAEPVVDPRSGTRCAIRDTRAAGAERYYWTVTVFGEPDPGGGWAHRRASSRTPAGNSANS